MITEDYCSYELAKLLKEKGFDEFCGAIYIILPNGDYRWSKIDYPHKNSVDTNPVAIMCPTHQMAMKWLREVHKLSVEISSTESGRWMTLAYELGETRDFVEAYISTYDTYEEATEAAIKYSLENLI